MNVLKVKMRTIILMLFCYFHNINNHRGVVVKMKYQAGDFDVAVIEAGHAGCEAALATTRMGYKTLLFSISLEAVANMPCNPHMEEVLKGHLVREIDCLGGEMGKNIDKTMIRS